VYCDCCKHQFVCKACYPNRPPGSDGFQYWSPKFGRGHSVKDAMSGDSHLAMMLQAIMGQPVADSGGTFIIYMDGDTPISEQIFAGEQKKKKNRKKKKKKMKKKKIDTICFLF
jgi:hypothetical protein